jgi:hypothetical protein
LALPDISAFSTQIAEFFGGESGTRGATDFARTMAHVDPLIAHRPEFADTQPDLRVLTLSAPPTAIARIKENATPLLIGAGVGAAAALAIAQLTWRKQPSFTLFPVSKATLVGNLAKIAIMAMGRTMLRRAFARAVETAANQPA